MDRSDRFLVGRGRGEDCEAARPRLQQEAHCGGAPACAAQPMASTRAGSMSWRARAADPRSMGYGTGPLGRLLATAAPLGASELLPPRRPRKVSGTGSCADPICPVPAQAQRGAGSVLVQMGRRGKPGPSPVVGSPARTTDRVHARCRRRPHLRRRRRCWRSRGGVGRRCRRRCRRRLQREQKAAMTRAMRARRHGQAWPALAEHTSAERGHSVPMRAHLRHAIDLRILCAMIAPQCARARRCDAVLNRRSGVQACPPPGART